MQGFEIASEEQEMVANRLESKCIPESIFLLESKWRQNSMDVWRCARTPNGDVMIIFEHPAAE